MPRVTLKLRADIVIEKDGRVRLAFKNPAYYHQQVESLRTYKQALITIEPVTSKRSLQQNAYWHGICFPIIAELVGLTMSEAKDLCKQMFIQPKIIEENGVEVEVRRGSSDLAKWEGVEFTENVRELAQKLGGYIPTPEDAGYDTNWKAKQTTLK